MSTPINLILENNNNTINTTYDTNIDIFDMNIPPDIRINFINSIPHKQTIELINKLNSMYSISGTTLLKEFIIHICKHSNINPTLKIECCKCLCIKDPCIAHYNILNNCLQTLVDIPIPCKILAIVFLSKCSELLDDCIKHFKSILTNNFIECDFKYKMILSIENVHKLNKKTIIYPLLQIFALHPINFTTYRIIACQNLLQNYKVILNEYNTFNLIQNIVYSFATDDELDYNIRADATDLLLGLGDSEHQTLAREIIHILGNRGNTIYDNQQNIHNIDIDNSTQDIINTLYSIKLKKNINFQSIKNTILSPITDQIQLLQNKLDTLNISFNRIEIDRSLYGNTNISLNTLLCRVYNYISEHTHEEQLINRLEEELIDASGKCSTGYGTRLVNTLSGYDDLGLKISWEDNIIGKLSGNLNNKIQQLEDDELKDKILLEMTLSTDKDILCRTNFLTFLRENIGDIKKVIWKDLQDSITETDFELYFRKALSVYEGIKIL
jgi:hypothetical protein